MVSLRSRFIVSFYSFLDFVSSCRSRSVRSVCSCSSCLIRSSATISVMKESPRACADMSILKLVCSGLVESFSSFGSPPVSDDCITGVEVWSRHMETRCASNVSSLSRHFLFSSPCQEGCSSLGVESDFSEFQLGSAAS
jgi:hypothetical protein